MDRGQGRDLSLHLVIGTDGVDPTAGLSSAFSIDSTFLLTPVKLPSIRYIVGHTGENISQGGEAENTATFPRDMPHRTTVVLAHGVHYPEPALFMSIMTSMIHGSCKKVPVTLLLVTRAPLHPISVTNRAFSAFPQAPALLEASDLPTDNRGSCRLTFPELWNFGFVFSEA